MIKKYLSVKDYSVRFLIGPNGAGKTYSMKNSLKDHEKNSLFISEDGNLEIKMKRNKVITDLKSGVYILVDEKAYGTRGKEKTTTIKIDQRVIPLIKYCEKQIKSFEDMKMKSKGQEKMYNIFNELYRYVLNSIDIIYFDEPENFLDDMGLRKISKLFSLIEDAKIKLVVASHSFSLCSILKVPIEHLIFLNRTNINKPPYIVNNMNTINRKIVKELYEQESINIEQWRRKNSININGDYKKMLDYYTDDKFFNLYLNDVLYSEQFYRALFYQNIVIVEGSSEKRIVNKLDLNDELNSTFFYVAFGKAFVPFFAKLFRCIGKNVKIIIDTDSIPKAHREVRTEYAVTLYLKDTYQNDVIMFDPDLERYFKMDLTIFEHLIPEKNAKVYVADMFFQNKSNLDKFINHFKGK